MAKSSGNRSVGNRGGKGGKQAGGKGKGPGGWPSKTGKPSSILSTLSLRSGS